LALHVGTIRRQPYPSLQADRGRCVVDTVTGPVSPGRRDASMGLAREAIGLREVLFQSITHMAPAAAVAFSIIAGAQYAGGALPLAVVIALVGCACVAYTIGELARYLPSAGGMYTYTARGLHPGAGFLVAWGYAFVEPLVAPVLYLIFGIVTAGTLDAEFNCAICRADQWWIWSTVSAVIVFVLGYLGIQISTRAGTLLGLFEIAVFAAVSLWLIAKADQNTFEVFTTGAATVEGFSGLTGVFAASIYTILAFIGFEAAAPLAEETRDPRRTIRRAVIYSALGIGAFYVLTTYAATVFFGPSRMAGFAGFNNGDPWTGLGRTVWGAAWVLVFLAILNSAVANSNAGANATTRTWYAMGRIRVLPSFFTLVHPRWRSPYLAVIGQLIVGLGVALPLGFLFQPLQAFILIATMATAVIVLIYITVNLAAIRFYLTEHRAEFNVVKHLVIPLIGIAFFAPAWLTAMGIRAFNFVARLSGPARFTGLVVGIWVALGVLYLIYLSAQHPERIQNTGRIFIEEPEEAVRAGGR
jgi:amino acid transporter